MSWSIPFLFSFLWSSSYAASALSLPPSPSQFPHLLLPSNANITNTSTALNAGKLKIACNSKLYGKNLKVKSCRQLFGYFKKHTEPFAFAERDTGVPYDLPLPMRTYSDDALCFVQPILVKDAVVGHASTTELGQAAYTMLQACVVERGMGGLAMNIGGDNKVNIVISDFKPNIKCDTNPEDAPEWDSCVGIFTGMTASKKVQVFGESGDEGVQQELPTILESADGKCQAYIGIDGKDTLSSWYEIWESIIAVASMCARAKYRGGKAKGLGLHKNIFIELSARKAFSGTQLGSGQNVSFTVPSIAVQNFQSEAPQGNYSNWETSSPYELESVMPEQDAFLVTLPGESSANFSQVDTS